MKLFLELKGLKCNSAFVFVAGYVFCLVVLLGLTLFFLRHPEVYETHGFGGPAVWNELSPPGIRFTGDSGRYLPDTEYDENQKSMTFHGYQGYYYMVCLAWKCYPSLYSVVLMHVLCAAVSLYLLMDLTRELLKSSWWAWAAGLWYAGNLEIIVHHTAILTESLYISGVILVCWLAWWAQKKQRLLRMPLVFAVVLAVATLRPTGWILFPAIPGFWGLMLGRNWYQKLAVPVLILAAMLLVALVSRRAHQGIQMQTPAEHLYTGTVVWRTDIWRKKMPDYTGYEDNLRDGLKYGLLHPLASAELAARRVVMMVLRIRPDYSLKHNCWLLFLQLPAVLLGIAAIFFVWRQKGAWLLMMVIGAHVLVVALTFNDYDGRFSLYAMPQTGMLALWGLQMAGQRFFRLIPKDEAKNSAHA